MSRNIALMLILCGVTCLSGCGGGGSDHDDDGGALSELTTFHFSVDDEDVTNKTVTYNVSAGESVTINAQVSGSRTDVGATWSYRFKDGYSGLAPRSTSRNTVVKPNSGKIVVVGKPSVSHTINGVETISGTTTVNIVVQ